MAREIRLSMKVWDVPTRLFHWSVVVLVGLGYVSGLNGWIRTHFISGYALLTLLLFRLAWGFVGSDTARFAQFLRSPIEGLHHLSRFAAREPDNQIGHNAAGGWMVLVLLALLALETVSGLLASVPDDLVYGPLASRITEDTSAIFTRIHFFTINLILVAIGLHLLAIIAYAVVKRQDLVRPMVTGRKRLPGSTRPPRMKSPALAGFILAVAAALVWALVSYS